jgi:hypothetical protein
MSILLLIGARGASLFIGLAPLRLDDLGIGSAEDRLHRSIDSIAGPAES